MATARWPGRKPTLKRRLGQSINRALRPLGYEFVKQTHVSLGAQSSVVALAEHLQRLLPFLGIDWVVDVGANQGQYYEFLRDRVGYEGRVLSFEPIPELARDLQRRSERDPLWTVFDCALGSKEGELPLKVMSRSGWSSLLDKGPSGETEIADAITVERVVPVRVRPLDAVLATIPDAVKARLYLKVDAQGFDLEVLRGAERTVASACALQTELQLVSVYAGAPSFLSVLEFLRERGYAITGLFPIWTDRSLRLGEVDAVCRNMSRAEA